MFIRLQDDDPGNSVVPKPSVQAALVQLFEHSVQTELHLTRPGLDAMQGPGTERIVAFLRLGVQNDSKEALGILGVTALMDGLLISASQLVEAVDEVRAAFILRTDQHGRVGQCDTSEGVLEVMEEMAIDVKGDVLCALRFVLFIWRCPLDFEPGPCRSQGDSLRCLPGSIRMSL